MENWSERLKQLQERLGKTSDEMAEMLGITLRTLGEFTRPSGREPSSQIKKLVEIFEKNLEPSAPALREVPMLQKKLNLVIIHGDFQTADGGGVISVIDDMQKAAGDESGNNVFHFITVDPERDMAKVLAIHQNKRVKLHFFKPPNGLQNSTDAQCSYFATTSAWLAVEAKNLGHITLAANAKKFWPIACELKTLLEVDISFIREANSELTSEELSALEEQGIRVISPAGRHHGRVISIKQNNVRQNNESYGSYGFLRYVKQNPKDGSWIEQGASTIFFSWNHMRKVQKTGQFETKIDALKPGDIVGFAVGMNDIGACATDVTLIARVPESTADDASKELISVMEDAIKVCANETGWALVSSVGSRLAVLDPDYKKNLTDHGFIKINEVFTKNSEVFEFSLRGGGSTGYAAACVRVKNK